MENYITLEQLSKETNIAESTIRRYINKFDFLFEINNEKRTKRYHRNCVGQLIKINEMYKKGLTTEEIKKALSTDIKEREDTQPQKGIIEVKQDFYEYKESSNLKPDIKDFLLKQISLLKEIKDGLKNLEDVDLLKKEIHKKEIEIANLKRENLELKQYLVRLEEKINSCEKELSRLKKESDNTLMELFNNLKGEQKKEGQKFWWMRFFSK
jgi:DNA-binding transcriptional MerR regulator